MKRIYIKPEAETIRLTATVILASSDETIWNTQYGEGGNKDGVDNSDSENQPDPSSGAGAKSFNLWDDWE